MKLAMGSFIVIMSVMKTAARRAVAVSGDNNIDMIDLKSLGSEPQVPTVWRGLRG
jgi:hypothetical protein